jgi:hypothetical protein
MPDATPNARKIAKLIVKLVEAGMSRADAEREAPALAELVPDSRAAPLDTIAARKRESPDYGII